MAPCAPFLAESIYRDLPLDVDAPESVHLCSYPEADHTLIEPMLEQAVTRMQHIVLLGRQKRNQEKIKVKYPLSQLTIIHDDPSLLEEIGKLEHYILSELNVKEIAYSTDEDQYINLYAKPNSPVLGKRLGGRFKSFKQSIENLAPADIALLQEQGEITIEDERFVTDDILIFREPKEGTEALSDRFISIDLATTLTPELIEEGLAREVVNRIQKSRKDSGFNVADRIHICFNASPKLLDAVLNNADYIKRETLALEMTQEQDLPLSFDIDEHQFQLKLQVIDSGGKQSG